MFSSVSNKIIFDPQNLWNTKKKVDNNHACYQSNLLVGTTIR